MAKYPIVVVKENPGTPGKLVIEVRWYHGGQRWTSEMKLPHLVGTVRDEAELNGTPVQAQNKQYRLALGNQDLPD